MSGFVLKDSSLLRTQAYVDGQWIDGDEGKTVPVLSLIHI